MKILVTGCAGFIGSQTCLSLLKRGDEVLGVDNLNAYYEVSLKEARLKLLNGKNFLFEKIDISVPENIYRLFERFKPSRVIHLAAQPGVRHSLLHPHDYISSNVQATLNILEACRHNPVEHFVYASSSSVYGANSKIPYSVEDTVDHPLSLYAATKKATELMAHSYSHLYKIPCTGLRFFTVYGPWGRPDMSLFQFTKKILAGEPIEVFNFGKHKRDFTYIDDIVTGVIRVLDRVPQPDSKWNPIHPNPSTSSAPYRLFNIGNSQPVLLEEVIQILESCLGKKAEKKMMPIQPGDVLETYADISDLEKYVGYRPATPIRVGVEKFASWYRDFYQV